MKVIVHLNGNANDNRPQSLVTVDANELRSLGFTVKQPKERTPVVAKLAVTVGGRVIPREGAPMEVIFSWEFPSVSNPDKMHEVILRRNGESSCGCPSWIFLRKDKFTGIPQARGCKHTLAVADEIDQIRDLFGTGQPLPVYSVPAPTAAKVKKSKVYTTADLEVGITLRTRRMITIN